MSWRHGSNFEPPEKDFIDLEIQDYKTRATKRARIDWTVQVDRICLETAKKGFEKASAKKASGLIVRKREFIQVPLNQKWKPVHSIVKGGWRRVNSTDIDWKIHNRNGFKLGVIKFDNFSKLVMY
jgi:hypothetical protein